MHGSIRPMGQRTPSFEASPRFSGFDAYFAAEIAPFAPALALRPAAPRRRSWPQRGLIALALVYLVAAPAALWFAPDEMARFRPWAIAGCAFVLIGVLIAFLTPQENEAGPVIADDVWIAARRRIAAFFGLAHTSPPDADELRRLVAAAPGPARAQAFTPIDRIGGVIRRGAATGAQVDFVEGRLAGAPVAVCTIRFDGAAPGLAALLDDRIADVDLAGLAPLTQPPPEAHPGLAAFAESDGEGKNAGTDVAGLADALAAARDALRAKAANLAVVDDAARLYFELEAPIFGAPADRPRIDAVPAALADYDAILRLAERLAAFYPRREAAA